MNIGLLIHEWLVVALALGVLLVDLWLPPSAKRNLGYAAALGLGAILLYSLFAVRLPFPDEVQYAFGKMYALDGLALFFKRFFLLTAIIVLLMSVEFADRIAAGIGEFYALILFALSGMLFASSANNFALLFVSLELITVTFYVLTSFERGHLASLEAGVKYLIIGALSTGFTVFGIALVYGISGKLNFGDLAAVAAQFSTNKIFLFGLAFVGSRWPSSPSKSGCRTFIRARPRQRRLSWQSAPRLPALSCSCACSSSPCRRSRLNGLTC